MRLALYTNSSTIGGAEAVLADLVRHLASDFSVAVVGTDTAVVNWVASSRSSADSVVVQTAKGGSGTGRLSDVLAHRRAFKDVGADLVHVNMSTALSCTVALSSLSTLVTPYIIVEHLPGRLSRLHHRVLKSAFVALAQAHVAVGEKSAEQAARGLLFGSPPVMTIRNGVSVKPFVPREHDVPTIGVACRLEHQKGVDVLVEAVARIPVVRLVVAGSGSQEQALRELAGRLGVHDRVHFVGWLSRVEELLADIDLFVLPSRNEALPLALVEAMQGGVPVVATDVGSVGEVVRDGDTGLLVPPENPKLLEKAIRRVFADGTGRERMRTAAQQMAMEAFSVDRMVDQYQSLYRVSLCQPRSGVAGVVRRGN